MKKPPASAGRRIFPETGGAATACLLTCATLAVAFGGGNAASCEAQPPSHTASTNSSHHKPPANKDFTLDEGRISLKLDGKGTNLSVGSFRGDFPWVSLSFTVAGGCNHWFSKNATFVLDERTTLTIPWAAKCPLPPESDIVPVWLLESLSHAGSAVLSLEGATYPLSKSQLAALRSFYDGRLAPDPTWRAKNEPYMMPDDVVGARVWVSKWLNEAIPHNGHVAYDDNYSASFSDSTDGATLEFSGGRPDKLGLTAFHNVDSFDFRWSDLYPRGFDGLSCRDGNCIRGRSEWSAYAPGLSKRLGDSRERDTVSPTVMVMFMLYPPAQTPPDQTTTMERNNRIVRGITFLWYQHMFVDRR